LNCIAQYERRPRLWIVVALSAISAVGVLFREIVLLVPIAFLFARNPTIAHRLDFPFLRLTNVPRWSQWIPLVLGAVALMWVQEFVVPTDQAFSASQHLMERAYDRRLITYALGWVVAFGPALFVVLFDYRTAVGFLSRHKAFLVYTVGVALVGWAASFESERHALNWGAPIVYLLLGLTIERHMSWFRSAALVSFLVVTQAVINRVFWVVPQPDGDYRDVLPTVLLTPLGEGASYLHLFPDYLASRAVWLQSAEYAALGAILLFWLSRRAYLNSHAEANRPRPRRVEPEVIAGPRP
jgi:hypothetical protein